MNNRKFLWLLVVSFSLLFAGCIETSTSPNPTDPEPEPENPPTASDSLNISQIEPEEGAPGTLVFITGSGFSSTESEITVLIGGAEAKVEAASETEIEVIVPDEAQSGPVEITIDEETATGPTFTVLDPETEPDPDPEPVIYSVEGKVTHAQTGAGIEGATITFSNDLDPVQTDIHGTWSADDLEGPIAIKVEADGFDFPIQTRLVLGTDDDVDFKAFASYEPPRSDRIAYQYRKECTGGTYCDKPFDLWLMNSTGTKKEQLTDSSGSDRNPTWSPDGTKLAFDSDRDGDSHIWTMNADGSDLSNTGVKGSQPAWSPSGELIAYIFDGNIWVMELNGSITEVFNTGANYSYASAPAWSPDGSKIAFDLRETGGGETHIWVMEADGRHATQLTQENSPNRSPAWEHSGDRILYASGEVTFKQSRLRLMNVDGSNDYIKEEWPDDKHSLAQPAWSPNGQEIAYVYRSMIPINNRIYHIPFESGAWMPIAPDDPYRAEQFWTESPAWAPN